MNFKSQICTTREQSEQLLALGLKKETADMFYFFYDKNTYEINPTWETIWEDRNDYKKIIPAWSLGRLIEMMPLDVFDYCFTLMKNYPNGYSVEYDDSSYYHKENIYDTIIDGIEHLIKEGYFNKEYLVWKRKAKFRK